MIIRDLGALEHPVMPPIARQVGLEHRAFRAVRTHARHGPQQLRGDLNRFIFLLGGGGGRLFGP
jgi:hypothetical protein